jgi:hypothetical protein
MECLWGFEASVRTATGIREALLEAALMSRIDEIHERVHEKNL